MLSGALLLPCNDITFSKVFRRIIRVVLPLITWGAIYLEYISYWTGDEAVLNKLFCEYPMYHFWYVYMIIGLYLLLPLLNMIFKGIIINNYLAWYLFIIWFICAIIQTHYPIKLLELLHLSNLLEYSGYFILGGVLFQKRNYMSPYVGMLFILGVFITFWGTYYYSIQENKTISTFYENFSIGVFLSSVGGFAIFLKLKVPFKFRKLLIFISDKCFIIFFVHILVLELVKMIFVSCGYDLTIAITIILQTVVTFILSLCVAMIIRLLPKSRVIFG